MPKRTPEDACVEYAKVVALMRAETAKIKPWECARVAVPEVNAAWPGPTTPIDPCISTLFKKAGPFTTFGAQEEHREWQEEFEGEMCDRCTVSLKAVRARKALRQRLGAAKRSVEAVGKRLNAEAGKHANA